MLLYFCAEDYEAGLEVCVALEVEDMVQDNLERKFKVGSCSCCGARCSVFC